MKQNLNEVWELIDQLSLDEKKIIYKRMQTDINTKLNNILYKTNERCEEEPIPFEDITKEVEAVGAKDELKLHFRQQKNQGNEMATNQKNSCFFATALISESIGVIGAGDRCRPISITLSNKLKAT